jgi:hypothetical protein
MNNKYFSIIAAFFVGCSAFAQNETQTEDDLQLNTITTAVPFLQITPDSRSGALGDAGTALSPSSSSFFWNTSALAFSKKSNEIAISYSPWLQNLANDINLSHISGFVQLNNSNVVGGSLRYFSLGEIIFTDEVGSETMRHTPTEMEILAGYSYRLNERNSLGINGKFIFSDLTRGLVVPGAGQTRPGMAGAADVSYTYRNEEVSLADGGGVLTLAAALNNIGNKISYTALDNRDFLPTNLKIGTGLNFKFDQFNSLTWITDFSKLLVPTPPIYNFNDPSIIAAGMDPEVGVVAGMLQSFYDAPGAIVRDANDNPVQNADGTYQVQGGSVLREELSEIMISTGLEYWYSDIFAARMGYFHESINKGARQHFTFGFGLEYNMIGFDFSYLTSIQRNNPLQNTLRFTLRLFLGQKSKQTQIEP